MNVTVLFCSAEEPLKEKFEKERERPAPETKIFVRVSEIFDIESIQDKKRKIACGPHKSPRHFETGIHSK